MANHAFLPAPILSARERAAGKGKELLHKAAPDGFAALTLVTAAAHFL